MESTSTPTKTGAKPRRNRVLAKAALVAAVAAGVTGSSVALDTFEAAPAEALAGYKVTWTGADGLNVRSGPASNTTKLGWLRDGTPVDIACYVRGQVVGTRGNNVWYRLNSPVRNGYVTAAYVNTPSDPLPGVPSCSSPAPAPTPAPGIAGADRAIGWMSARMGSRAYDGWCLKAVWEAYRYGAGRDIGRAPTAYDYWVSRGGKRYDRTPPRGALVFFDGWYQGLHAGHVGIALGDGRYISTYDRTGLGIHVGTLAGRTSYLGWIAP